MDRTPFNRPYVTGAELSHIEQVVGSKHLSGNGAYTRRCQAWFEQSLGLGKALLTCSCTDALEMCALLLDLGPGDEVIVPSYTFVSTANAFALRGATLRFADSCPDNPNIDPDQIRRLLCPRTRAVVIVHYAGFPCDMEPILELVEGHGIALVEDAAHALGSSWRGRPLGSLGRLAAFSFHETKNITCGEGGLLAVNDPALFRRSEVIWEKGTDRAAFYRGEVDKYGWVDLGSSFLASELAAAFLWGQLESYATIQSRRCALWEAYHEALDPLARRGLFQIPYRPAEAVHCGHMFYLVCRSGDERDRLIAHLRARGIHAVFHYLPLHQSSYFAPRHDGRQLPNAVRFADTLVRLPLYVELGSQELDRVVGEVKAFFGA